VMGPGEPRNCRPVGTLMDRSGEVLIALKLWPSANLIAWAVVARKEPPRLSWALGPKRMPEGLSRKRLAWPWVLIRPSIAEVWPPVTRLKMFWTVGSLLKMALLPAGRENWLKLWNRFWPARLPLLISKVVPLGRTWVDRLPSGRTWDWAMVLDRERVRAIERIPGNLRRVNMSRGEYRRA
jgi:hypothetical protein